MNRSIRTLKYYYLVTPIFVGLDVIFDFNIRVTIPFGNESIEYLYYAICFSASFVLFRSERTASMFCLAECTINLAMLALSVVIPIANLGSSIENGGALSYQFGAAELTHFLVAGAILLFCFYTNPLIVHSKKHHG